MSKYYCLVAGLPELSLEDGKLTYSVANFKTELYADLSNEDKKLVDLFYLKFDNANILKLLNNKDANIDSRGNYSAEELNALITSVKEGDAGSKNIPSYLSSFISVYFQSNADESFMPTNSLASYYYDYAMNCKNKFVSSWFELNLNINNLLTAYTARKYKVEVAPNIVGQTEVCEAIRTSNARDFGLQGVIDYFEPLLRISETVELVEREKKIDMLKWNWIEDAAFFDYFTVEKLFAFLLRLEMIERWISLDKEKGREFLRKIIESLKND
ncbi:MAG: DUF2764 family protein, partial [Bacteroidaceae bacterium]